MLIIPVKENYLVVDSEGLKIARHISLHSAADCTEFFEKSFLPCCSGGIC